MPIPDSAPMPKHIPFPEVSVNSELICELITTAFTLTSAILQYINVHRTNWWMEESYVHHAVDLKSVNMDLVTFILISTTRRLLFLILLKLFSLFNIHLQKKYLNIIKYIFALGFFCAIGYIVWKMYKPYSIVFAVFLNYPLFVYVLIFGLNIDPFLRLYWEIEGAYFNGMPFHSCSANPTNIRDEVETLKTDYNRRFKQIVFTSMVNAYYAGFIPVCLPSRHYYNAYWAAQHIFFIWLTTFMMGTVFLFPSKYIDVLHRASLHLGCWQKLNSNIYETESGEKVEVNAISWNKNNIWTENSFVKYNNHVYRSLTSFTVSWPGNKSHNRFYRFFHSPEQIFLYMFCGQGCIIMIHILLLFFSMEWHFMLSITFVAFTNQFVFFRIARDFLVTKRVYTTESSIADKHFE